MIDYVSYFIGAFIMGFALFYGIACYKSMSSRIL